MLTATVPALLAVSFSSFALGLFVYRKNSQSSVNAAWLRFCVATGGWSLGTACMLNAPSYGWAFLSARLAQASFALIPIFFSQFCLCLRDTEVRETLFFWLNKILAGIFAGLSLTPLIFARLQTDAVLRFYPMAGPFYGAFAVWFVASFLASLLQLLGAYRSRTGYKRSQLIYVILASVFALVAFFSVIPLTFGIAVYPLGPMVLIFYALILYAIIRWRLMDISVIVKNTLIYASLYSILIGFFVVTVVFFGQLFFYGPQALDKRVLWMCAVALGIVTALVRPLDAWLLKLTDKLLFQRKHEWQKTLKEASKGMAKVTSVDRLFKLMAHFIGMRVRVTHVGVLHRSGDSYTLKVSRGREKRPVGIVVERDNPLVTWLEEKKEVISREEVQSWLRNEKMFPHKTVLSRTLSEIDNEMSLLGSKLCVPAFSKSQMMGFLVLGDKLSGEPYTREDVDLLSTLANEGAIALENVQLYEQLYQRMHEIEDLYQREHRLFIHTAIALAAAVDARDPYTHGHTERCTAYALAIAEEMGLHPEMAGFMRFKEMLKVSALLHDIGKIGIPDDILRKKSKLTLKEFQKMKEHSIIGAIIPQPIRGMEEISKAVKAHHERYDGKGYPDGLRGTEIPLMTRIVSVADTFDAMTTDRPYRRRLSDVVAVKEIESGTGTQFDPVVVQAFLRAYQRGLISMRPVEATDMLR